jgi:ATP-binding cassette subfamily B multidrug efflux pump
MGRLLAILDAPVDISDDEVPSEDASWEPHGAVELRGLTLRLGQRDILRDVDLVVPAGTSCAIVGPTGSGKSVLVGLIPRLLDAPRGTVWLDGREIRSIPLRLLRSAVGFVPQETYLFSETISNNVALALSDADSPPPLERVGWASSVAQLEKDVADFPEGYETRVGERGVTLSGGQRQRTALARALVRDPRILVLDDALSAVDAQTEDRILMGLREVMRSRTTFIVSHRISTVRDADQIVVLRDGRIVERGTHADLVGRNGFYADLHSRQLIEDQIETE